MKILVTGAGGPAGICVIKDLIKRHEIIATDIDWLSSGLYLVKNYYLVPRVDDENFIKQMLDITKKENVSVIVPTVNEEMIRFSENLDIFEKENISVIVSNKKVIEIATNKLSTYRFFEKEIYCPKLYERDEIIYPCVVKPIASRGSRGFYICSSTEEVEVALKQNTKNIGESVIMEYLKGDEYSVYGVSDLNRNPLIAVPIKRIQAVSESKKAQVIKEKDIISVANDMASRLGFIGPWNIQLIKTIDGPKIVEINPRFGGTTSLIIAAGINYVELAIKVFTNQRISSEELEYKDNIFMTRYNEEIFIRP
jgi:carbamoyl-phosphate synthase large subunit